MIPEHGTFRRYVITSMVNFLVFYTLWEILVFLLPNEEYWPTVSWAAAWFLGSLQAHWTHRIWTFNSSRDIRWTIPTTMILYLLGGLGSTTCYYIGTVTFGLDFRLFFLVNSSLWGFLKYIGQREIAFKEVNTFAPLGNE